MKVGDLVKVNVFSDFTRNVLHVNSIPYDAIGIIIREKRDVCRVYFLEKNKTRRLMKKDLIVISEAP